MTIENHSSVEEDGDKQSPFMTGEYLVDVFLFKPHVSTRLLELKTWRKHHLETLQVQLFLVFMDLCGSASVPGFFHSCCHLTLFMRSACCP